MSRCQHSKYGWCDDCIGVPAQFSVGELELLRDLVANALKSRGNGWRPDGLQDARQFTREHAPQIEALHDKVGILANDAREVFG